MSVDNPRWPHTFKVIRQVNVGTNSRPELKEEVILESECRIYMSTYGSRNKTQSSVLIADYTVSFPRENALGVNVEPNYIIEATDVIRTFRGIALGYQINNLGANIWFNESKN